MSERREVIQSALDAAHTSVRRVLDQLSDPEAAMPGYDGWTKHDLVVHLISIESRLRDQVRSVIERTPWAPEDVDTFNARQVALRRGATVDELRRDLDEQERLSRAVLGSLTNADLASPFDHPRRGRMTVEDLWRIIPGHAEQHVADLERVSAGSSAR